MPKREYIGEAEVAAIKKHKEAVEKLEVAFEEEMEELRKTAAKTNPKAAFESRLHALADRTTGGWHVNTNGEDKGDGIFEYLLYAEHHFAIYEEDAEYLKDTDAYTVTYFSKDRRGNRVVSKDGMHAECQDHDVYTLDMHFEAKNDNELEAAEENAEQE